MALPFSWPASAMSDGDAGTVQSGPTLAGYGFGQSGAKKLTAFRNLKIQKAQGMTPAKKIASKEQKPRPEKQAVPYQDDKGRRNWFSLGRPRK